MLRKLVMAVPIVSAFALCAPGSSQSVQSAPVLTDLDSASNSLIQLVRDRGGGGQFFRGGGGGGRGWGGGGGGFRGGGHVFRGGGGGFSRPSFGGGGRYAGRPSFRGYSGGFAGRPSYRRFGGDGPRWRGQRFSNGDFRRPDFRHGGRGKHYAHWKRKHHRRYYPFYYGDFGYYTSSLYSYDDCAYLRDRAIATGSRYWWRRYQYCEYGNY